MSETTPQPAERDLVSAILRMEEDVRSAVEFFHAVIAIASARYGLDGPQCRGLARVGHAGLSAAEATEAAWERTLEMAKVQRKSAAA
jgi:hypothetical protein